MSEGLRVGAESVNSSRAMRLNIRNKRSVLMRPFARREAVLSSKIEGTQATLGELLAANPFITAHGAVEKLGIAFTTAQRAIERLERLRIVQQVGSGKRVRVYCAKMLLDILEEPAQLSSGAQ